MCAQTTTDRLSPKGDNRTSQIVTTILLPGVTFPLHQAGDKFYLVVATGPVKIKPNNGSENEYVQGTGLVVDDLNIFKNIQLRNDTLVAVVLQVFVGFGSYIDNRLIVYDPNSFQISYPTSPVANVTANLAIPDRSATAVQDINGINYLLLNRTAIYISNVDIASAYDLQNDAANKTILTIQPLTDIVYNANGNFRIKPVGNFNGTVSEVYNAIKPT